MMLKYIYFTDTLNRYAVLNAKLIIDQLQKFISAKLHLFMLATSFEG